MAFYKKDGDELLVGENFVSATGFELLAELHSSYDYPVDGWYWFDDFEQATITFRSEPELLSELR